MFLQGRCDDFSRARRSAVQDDDHGERGNQRLLFDPILLRGHGAAVQARDQGVARQKQPGDFNGRVQGTAGNAPQIEQQGAKVLRYPFREEGAHFFGGAPLDVRHVHIPDSGLDPEFLIHRFGRNFRGVEIEILRDDLTAAYHGELHALGAGCLQQLNEFAQVHGRHSMAVDPDNAVARAQARSGKGGFRHGLQYSDLSGLQAEDGAKPLLNPALLPLQGEKLARIKEHGEWIELRESAPDGAFVNSLFRDYGIGEVRCDLMVDPRDFLQAAADFFIRLLLRSPVLSSRRCDREATEQESEQPIPHTCLLYPHLPGTRFRSIRCGPAAVR